MDNIQPKYPAQCDKPNGGGGNKEMVYRLAANSTKFIYRKTGLRALP